MKPLCTRCETEISTAVIPKHTAIAPWHDPSGEKVQSYTWTVQTASHRNRHFTGWLHQRSEVSKAPLWYCSYCISRVTNSWVQDHTGYAALQDSRSAMGSHCLQNILPHIFVSCLNFWFQALRKTQEKVLQFCTPKVFLACYLGIVRISTQRTDML